MPQAPSSHVPHTVSTSVTSITPLQRNNRRTGRPDASHSVLNVSPVYSRRDPFSVDNGRWPFDDRDHAIVCTVTNNMLNTDMSLWTPLLTENARHQTCIQFSVRCCNCGCTEYSLRWCPAPFENVFFYLLNSEFGTHNPDGSVFETRKLHAPLSPTRVLPRTSR